VNVNSLTFAKNGLSNIAFTEATVLKTTEAAASVASNVATALHMHSLSLQVNVKHWILVHFHAENGDTLH